MNNVRHLRPPLDFDQDMTAVIEMVNPTPPLGISIPFHTLLAGPASDPDHTYQPVRHPRPCPRWVTSSSLVTIGWGLGVIQMFVAARWF